MYKSKINIKCNCCGESCNLPTFKEETEPYGLVNQEVSGGYSSTAGNGFGALDDTITYKFSLCEFCLDWLFSQFRIPVETDSYMGGGQAEPWKPALQRVKEDDWRNQKEKFYAEYLKRKQARNNG